MTLKELNEQMLQELHVLVTYHRYSRLLIAKPQKVREQSWKEYVSITGEIIQILHKIGDDSQDKLYEGMIQDEYRNGHDVHLIQRLDQKIETYIEEYTSRVRRCNVCGGKVFYAPLPRYYEEQRIRHGGKKTVPETLNSEEYVCPVCGSVDRDRLIVGYLQKKQLLQKGKKILQIAPAKAIDTYIKSNAEVVYETADLFMEGVTYRTDIQDMKEIASDTYDVWICSHVLEHVPDDRKALSELKRILKPNGIGILLVPLDLSREETDEEVGCSEEENWRRFGQGDHVRAYAKKDFLKRVKEAGFRLNALGKEYFGEEMFREAGLLDTSTLYVVEKTDLKRAASYWNNYQETERSRWWHSSEIIRHYNEKVCGKPLDGWNAGGIDLLKRRLNGRKLQKAISIGCGTGMKEIGMLKSGIVESFVCYDISQHMIDIATQNAEKEGFMERMNFCCSDFFASGCSAEAYDLVFWDNSLHHMPDARQAVKESERILKKGGFFFCNDFVGESRFQWTDMEMAIVNGLRLYLPDKYFYGPEGRIFKRFQTKPEVEQMIQSDPSEAADSSNILPAIEEIFSDATVIPTGGLIYSICLEDIIYNMEENSELLKYMLELDDQTIQFGLTLYAFALAEKRGM